jgi:hypothetical protein
MVFCRVAGWFFTNGHGVTIDLNDSPVLIDARLSQSMISFTFDASGIAFECLFKGA